MVKFYLFSVNGISVSMYYYTLIYNENVEEMLNKNHYVLSIP